MNQVYFVSLEELVPVEHTYRKILELIDFSVLTDDLSSTLDNFGETGANGFGVGRLFRCLVLQFMEDLSDRELERYLQENVSAKYFCEFDLCEPTPDHTTFCKARKRVGVKRLSQVFEELKMQLKKHGYMNEIFNFVDATHLISKANLWKERDKAIAERYEKLNNEVLPKFAHDKQAKIGCKGKDKFWYGYKQHTCVDMQSGLITKIAITPANVTDAQGLQHVCPQGGALYGDKGYCVEPAVIQMKKKGCHNATIKLNNMKSKDRDKDKWLTKIRAPYERTFAKRPKRVRYVGIAKNQFSAFMQATVFNIKRLISLQAPPLSV